ncbi:hypothetical protein PI124_g597 [Phytophthora idaei]|nr:hypothetical protein PI126_g2844 [Phytophthora idaei]KAG3254851.1 hypothetical protein PI124_g597 [Phytophthora idaei]
MDDMRVKRVNFSKDVDGSKLQLFLAKKEGAWLTRAGAEAVTVDELGHPRDFEKMVPSLLLQDAKYFGEKFQLSGGQVHVLAVVPEVPASKRRRIDAITSPRSEELVALAAFGQQLNRETALPVGELLVLPKTVFGTSFWNGLYIRQEYWDLYNMIEQKLADGTGRIRRILVIGSPGIGKSVFGVFLLLVFLIERRNVAYHACGDVLT